jgi:hypothetical protein
VNRFWDKVDRVDPDECWTWQAATRKGYGVFFFCGRLVPAHRFAYELLVGSVPDGLELDHLCRNRGCVNPAHLEPVTRSVNVLRGESGARLRQAWIDRKSHCDHGHPLSGANLRVQKTGKRAGRRMCRACQREAQRRYAAKKAAG